jgi:long-chain acyl-CoA synthetase
MSAAVDKDQPAISRRHPWVAQYPRHVDWLLDIPVRPVPALLDDAVAAFAARPFLDFLGRRYSYAQAGQLIAKAAAGFQRLGVRKGTKVGLLLPNSPYSVICYFAILKAGGTVVNYDPLCAEQELIAQIEDSETDIMVTLDLTALYGKVAAALAKTSLRCIVICQMARALPYLRGLMFRVTRWREIAQPSRGAGHIFFDEMIDNSGAYQAVETAPLLDVAIIQYTGGTTGEPKGVMLSHQNIYANACQTRAWFTRAEPGRERLLAIIPFSHAFGMTAVMNFAISLGGELVLVPRFDLKRTLRAIARRRVTILAGVPTLFNAINQCPEIKRYDLSSLKICISGGDSLPSAVKERFVELTRCPLAEGYGLTECAPVVTCSNPLESIDRPGSCGLPLPRTTVEIVSLQSPRTVLPSGERGEICVSGPQVMLGYWRNAEATRNCLIGGRLYTGDLGWMDADGFLYFVDRQKELISVHGYKVYPRNVEDAIRQHPAVADVVVIGVPDLTRGQVPKAYVVLAEGAQLSEDTLQAFLADKLSPLEIPHLVEFRRDLPKSTMGKVLKRAV